MPRKRTRLGSAALKASSVGSPSAEGFVQPTDPPARARSGMPHKRRVFVVEDHSFVREGIASILDGQPDLCYCGDASTVAAAPAAVVQKKPDLVLMDLRLKDGETFDLVSALRRQFPTLPILVLTQCEETLYAERALQAGARGYLMKMDAASQLLFAIRSVLSGNVYLSQAMGSRLVQRVLKPGLKATVPLPHQLSKPAPELPP